MTYSFPDLEPVCCSMSSSNCFLTCTQISQEAGQVVWYSHLFQNFPQFIVIHTVKGFGVVNKAKVDVFLELSFSMSFIISHSLLKLMSIELMMPSNHLILCHLLLLLPSIFPSIRVFSNELALPVRWLRLSSLCLPGTWPPALVAELQVIFHPYCCVSFS